MTTLVHKIYSRQIIYLMCSIPRRMVALILLALTLRYKLLAHCCRAIIGIDSRATIMVMSGCEAPVQSVPLGIRFGGHNILLLSVASNNGELHTLHLMIIQVKYILCPHKKGARVAMNA